MSDYLRGIHYFYMGADYGLPILIIAVGIVLITTAIGTLLLLLSL